MKKYAALLCGLCAVSASVLAQDVPTPSYIRPQAIGVSFFLNDFVSPSRIRSTSLTSVIAKEQMAKFKDMAPGIAVTYFKGLKQHIDFSGTLAGSFVNIPLEGKTVEGDKFLLEADAAVDLKMFSEKYIFTPYIHLGVGASKYGNSFGAFVPVGGGFKVNIFDEASVFLLSQYRVPLIRETNGYHLMHSIGISGRIGKD